MGAWDLPVGILVFAMCNSNPRNPTNSALYTVTQMGVFGSI